MLTNYDMYKEICTRLIETNKNHTRKHEQINEPSTLPQEHVDPKDVLNLIYL